MTVQEARRPLRSPVVWFGGKGQIAGRICALLPPHVAYVEPFAGGLSVLFRKLPAAVETVNDTADGLVHFYRVLRDPALFPQFARLAALTPYARAEWAACHTSWMGETDPVRRAWAWFVMVRQSFAGHVHEGASPTWGYSRQHEESSAGRKWLSAVDGLPAVHARLRHVQVEHGGWRAVLDRYMAPGVLAYCDPPYVLDSRPGGARYEHEMSLDDHCALTEYLLACAGMVVLSGYRHEAVHGPLENAGWERTDMTVAINAAREARQQRRTESVWRNPAAIAARRQPSLFGQE